MEVSLERSYKHVAVLPPDHLPGRGTARLAEETHLGPEEGAGPRGTGGAAALTAGLKPKSSGLDVLLLLLPLLLPATTTIITTSTTIHCYTVQIEHKQHKVYVVQRKKKKTSRGTINKL